MTVITMPTTEKKSDNVPLVTNIEIDPSAQVSELRFGFFFIVIPPRTREFGFANIINGFLPSPPVLLASIAISCFITTAIPALCYFPVSSTSRSSDVLFFF